MEIKNILWSLIVLAALIAIVGAQTSHCEEGAKTLPDCGSCPANYTCRSVGEVSCCQEIATDKDVDAITIQFTVSQERNLSDLMEIEKQELKQMIKEEIESRYEVEVGEVELKQGSVVVTVTIRRILRYGRIAFQRITTTIITDLNGRQRITVTIRTFTYTSYYAMTVGVTYRNTGNHVAASLGHILLVFVAMMAKLAMKL